MATHHKTELSLDDGSTYVVATADIEAGPNLSFAVTGQLPGSYVCRLRITPVAGGTPVVSDSFIATFGVVSANGSQSLQLENVSAVTSMLASVASNQSIQSETLVAVSLQMASVASLQSGQTEAATSPNYNAIIAASIQASQLESVVASMLQNGIVVASQSVQAESITSTISQSGTLANVQAVQAETIIEKTSSLALVTSAQSAQTETGVEVTKRFAVVASIQAAQTESAAIAAPSSPTLLNFENGLIDSKSNTWSFASGTPGAYGSVATGTLGAFGAGTYHSSTHSFQIVQGAFDDYGEGAYDVTEGHITGNATIGAGKISLWIKANGGAGRVFAIVDSVLFSYFVPDGTNTSGLDPTLPIDAPSDVFTKMISIMDFAAGTHTINLGIWAVDTSPPTPGLIIYVDDLELP